MYLRQLPGVLLLFYFVPVSSGEVNLTPPVETEYGPIQGSIQTYDGTTVHVFKGVPYAAPPQHKLRFAPPEPPKPWTEPKSTIKYKSRCYADTTGDGLYYHYKRKAPPVGEDCLHLSIVAPEVKEGDEPRAVMVHIHGGGLMAGSSADVDLEALAIVGDVIHVAMNYRLNVFGFLATMDDSAPGNVGFLDQVHALKWIQKNIGAFGGDPERVLIYGMSGGGWSVSAHMVSPLSDELFSRAASFSGSLYGYHMDSRAYRAEMTEQLGVKVHCPTKHLAQMLACIRSIPTEELYKAVSTLDYFPMNPATWGDEFLPAPIRDLYDAYNFTGEADYLLSTASEEGGAMITMFPAAAEGMVQMMRSGDPEDGPAQRHALSVAVDKVLCIRDEKLKNSVRRLIQHEYFGRHDNSDEMANLRAALDLMGDVLFNAPVAGTAHRVSESQDNNAMLAYFDQSPAVPIESQIQQFHLEGMAAPEANFGSAHGLDALYLYGHALLKDVPMSIYDQMPKEDKIVAKSYANALTSFAKLGEAKYIFKDDLFDEEEAVWPHFSRAFEIQIIFKHPMTYQSMKTNMSPNKSDFWNSLLPAYIKQHSEKVAEAAQPTEPSEPSKSAIKDEL